ncbi:uncharacterized protein MYCFIDRAFT_128265 [Pseudocercospora fijiensis CIRAD86]|uniref:Suppressor of forked domain-containing protein n=1 Tax=Pseudocercospora fijiensis (strain CIRAD86) TaxID=383855 RepID=N1QB48_PSEFD|nr:uncharacterized protein MYCFIDRAFT_128265 [Pseudocercospora fijiensis CIRAD86]EME89236.1 hypothetical protein MYCFIDRAFT_128265 [Pseudocercospora fijiensis CIRAD86]
MEPSRGPPRVKNKAPAPQQISAEQLLREAVDRQEPALEKPTTRFADLEELHEYQGRKRKEFEDYVRRNRLNMGNWFRYAAWELEQKEYRRARSVFERALDCEPTNVQLWVRYIESEMKERNINHARNLLDRAVSILPRVDKLWYKYVYMEEMLGNIPGTRAVFERWMSWEPDEAAWSAYIKLEKRYGEFDRARNIFERFTIVHPEPRNWIKWAKFEEENGTSDLVREVFGMAIEALGDEFMDEKLFIAYAKFEAKLKEYERSRAIYKYALDRMPRSKSAILHKIVHNIEKQFGDREGSIKTLKIVPHKKFTFAKLWVLKAQFHLRRQELDKARKTVGRAIGMCPKNKLFRAYIEMELKLFEFVRCRTLYEKWIEFDPSNSQAWIKFAELEHGLEDLDRTRAIFELAIQQDVLDMPELVWKAYIDFEEEEGAYDKTRDLYERLLQKTEHVKVWISYAHFELNVPDAEEVSEEATVSEAAKTRARKTFERAHKLYRDQALVEERVSLLNAWKSFEDTHGSEQDIEKVAKMLPRKVKKRRKLDDDSFEEYMDYVFPADDESSAKVNKLMMMAQKWKREQEGAAAG